MVTSSGPATGMRTRSLKCPRMSSQKSSLATITDDDAGSLLLRISGAALGRSSGTENMADRVIPFVARVLEYLIRVVAHERHRHGPLAREDVRILDGDLVADCVRVGAGEAFHQP